MDGFATTQGVVVLAGTNRPDILDKASSLPCATHEHSTANLRESAISHSDALTRLSWLCIQMPSHDSILVEADY